VARSQSGRAGRDGHGHRARASDRIGRELLADATDGAAAFGQCYRWRGESEFIVAIRLPVTGCGLTVFHPC